MTHTCKNLKIVFVKFFGKIWCTFVAHLAYIIAHHLKSICQIVKNWGPGLHNLQCHTDDTKYFLGLWLTQDWREVVEICTCSSWEKGNFVLIYWIQIWSIWRIWSSLLFLSLCNDLKTTVFYFLYLKYHKLSLRYICIILVEVIWIKNFTDKILSE